MARVDVYQAILDAQEHTIANGIKLNPEEQLVLDRAIRDRKRNGLGLDDEKRNELLEIKKRIADLSIDFQRACNEEKGFLLFTREVRFAV